MLTNYDKQYRLIDEVINPGYCVGCGACAASKNSPFNMTLDHQGTYKPVLNNNQEAIEVAHVCPFFTESKNEDDLGKLFFKPHKTIKHHVTTGYYLRLLSGYVNDESMRSQSTSGGFATWLSYKLLKQDDVDGIVHVKQAANSKQLFEYGMSFTNEEIDQGATSKYYPIELSQIIKQVKATNKRFVFVGVPCFIKAIRLLAEHDERFKKQVAYTIGIVCGHLKSTWYTDAMTMELGLNPDDLAHFEYRIKVDGQPASEFGVKAHTKETSRFAMASSLHVSDWGQGPFQLKACDYCDDVLAELADVTCGDAWLKKYESDHRGASIMIVRHPVILQLLETYQNELTTDECSLDEIFDTQAGGFRHRHQGLAYRLYLDKQQHIPTPKKRIKPSESHLTEQRKAIYKYRVKLRETSFIAYQKAREANDFSVYVAIMDPLIAEYKNIYKTKK